LTIAILFYRKRGKRSFNGPAHKMYKRIQNGSIPKVGEQNKNGNFATQLLCQIRKEESTSRFDEAVFYASRSIYLYFLISKNLGFESKSLLLISIRLIPYSVNQ